MDRPNQKCFLNRIPENATFEDFERNMEHLPKDIHANSAFDSQQYENYRNDISKTLINWKFTFFQIGSPSNFNSRKKLRKRSTLD